MKAVVLDGYTLNPGDLDWKKLESLVSKLEIHDRSNRKETLVRAAGAEILYTNKTVLDADILRQLPDLKYIGVLATGYNVVDVETAAERGVAVTNVPAYSTEAVAQHVFALVLALSRRVEHHADAVREGRWAASPDFAFWDYPQIDLGDLVLGIIGYGNIGRAVARIGQAMGMRVLVNSRSQPDDLPEGVRFGERESVIRESDVLTLHCPLSEETQHLMNAERLATMKPTAFLINTGRGPLIDESALADALRSNRLAGAGLDVLSMEPPAADHPLYGLDNCLITPHIAWATQRARRRMMDITVANLKAWLARQPQNVVTG